MHKLHNSLKKAVTSLKQLRTSLINIKQTLSNIKLSSCIYLHAKLFQRVLTMFIQMNVYRLKFVKHLSLCLLRMGAVWFNAPLDTF